MPYRRRTTTRRKRARRTRRRSIPRAVPSSPYGLSKIMSFRYCDQVTINPLVGAIGTYVFNANSLYDPNQTGTGHQPMGFDQWTTFFNHYTVLGSKITANFTIQDLTAANSDDAVVGIYLADDSSLPFATTTEMMEQGKAHWKYISSRNSTGMKMVRHTYSAKRFHNVSDVKDNAMLTGTMGNFGTGANPTETACFHLFAGPQNGLNDVGAILCNVTMEFIATLSEPKDLVES